MSARARRRGLAALVGLALCWPAAHYGLSRLAGSDPWELFGFAMYTVPHPRIQVELRVTVDGRQHALRTAGSLRRDVEDYARRKTTLGRWVSDDDFARSLLDRNPTWEAVTLVLHRWRLDRESARWRVRSESIAVRREGASALPSGQAGAM